VTSVIVSGTGFQLTNQPVLPATLESGRELRFGVLFSPPQPGTYSGSLQLTLGGYSISIVLEGSTPPPKFTLYYTLSDGNARPLAEGGRLTFLPTPAKTTAQAEVVVATRAPAPLNPGSHPDRHAVRTSGIPVFLLRSRRGKACGSGCCSRPSKQERITAPCAST